MKESGVNREALELTKRLKPCPFCGGLPGVDVFFAGYIRPGRYEARCVPCNVILNDDRTDKVIANWNRRAIEK